MPTSLLTVTPLTVSGISHVFDNIPQQGLLLWLDATKIAGITSGTSLSAWTDVSARGATATQASAASQPQYVTNIQGGLPAVQFFGNQFLQSATSLTQPCTVACASSASTFGAGNPFIVGGDISGSGFDGLFIISNKYVGFAGSVLNGSNATVNAWVSLIGEFSGSSSTVAVSGVTFAGNAGANNSLNVRIGATGASANTFTGYIGELMVYNRALPESERLSLETYLRTKWGTL